MHSPEATVSAWNVRDSFCLSHNRIVPVQPQREVHVGQRRIFFVVVEAVQIKWLNGWKTNASSFSICILLL